MADLDEQAKLQLVQALLSPDQKNQSLLVFNTTDTQISITKKSVNALQAIEESATYIDTQFKINLVQQFLLLPENKKLHTFYQASYLAMQGIFKAAFTLTPVDGRPNVQISARSAATWFDAAFNGAISATGMPSGFASKGGSTLNALSSTLPLLKDGLRKFLHDVAKSQFSNNIQRCVKLIDAEHIEGFAKAYAIAFTLCLGQFIQQAKKLNVTPKHPICAPRTIKSIFPKYCASY